MNDGDRKEQISVGIIVSCLEAVNGIVYWKKDRPRDQFNSGRGYKVWKKKHSGKVFGSLKYSCGNVYRHGTITVKDKTIKILAHNAAFLKGFI